MLDEQVDDATTALAKLLGKPRPEGEPSTPSSCEDGTTSIVVRAVERKTGLAETHRIRREHVRRPTTTASFVRVHGELVELAGTPPSRSGSASTTAEALSFEELRRCVLEVAQRGRQAPALQGPGRDERRPARRDDDGPGTRTLQQVTMEDASAADELFSMLMGDQVEPRRDFIETHAKSVTNLDV